MLICNNKTRDVTDEDLGLLHLWISISQTWGGIISIIGFTTNFLTVVIILWQISLSWRLTNSRPRSLSNSTNSTRRPVIPLSGYTLLLLNLCLCDLLYCAINLPMTAYTYTFATKNDGSVPEFCTFAAFFRYTNALVEWLTLGLLTLQRCVDLKRSREGRFFKSRPTLFLIIVIWIIGIMPHIALLLTNEYGYDTTNFKCEICGDTARVLFFSLEAAIPCCIMVFGGCSIANQIWKNVERLRENNMPEELIENRRRHMMKSVKLITALVSLFITCVFPLCIYSIISVHSRNFSIHIDVIIFMIYWIQYGVNVFLYVVRNEDFRTAFAQFFNLACAKKLFGTMGNNHGKRLGAVSCVTIHSEFTNNRPISTIQLLNEEDYFEAQENTGSIFQSIVVNNVLSCSGSAVTEMTTITNALHLHW